MTINEKLRAYILLSSSTKSCCWNVSGEETVGGNRPSTKYVQNILVDY